MQGKHFLWRHNCQNSYKRAKRIINVFFLLNKNNTFRQFREFMSWNLKHFINMMQNQKKKNIKFWLWKSIIIYTVKGKANQIKKITNIDLSVTAWCCSHLLFKLNHQFVHISVWVNEKSVNNQTGSLTDQCCQQAAENLPQRCARACRRLVDGG